MSPVRHRTIDGVGDPAPVTGVRNVPADVSVGSVVLGLAIYVVRFERDFWLFTVPACGLVAVVSGVLGLRSWSRSNWQF
jgi:hypothetical protein